MQTLKIANAWVAVSLAIAGVSAAGGRDPVPLRQQYNAASAQIDSLVREMGRRDSEAADPSHLPNPSRPDVIPPGMKAVIVFWADDEAQVWLNDYPVGETRLTPVEVEVPSLYFRSENELRVRCWDTDFVESGLMLALYLEDGAGSRYPILATDDSWRTEDGPAVEITYAHPMPDIAGSVVIWSGKMLGKVEFRRSFTRREVESAASGESRSPASRPSPPPEAMDYHRFVGQLAVLEEKREGILRQLGSDPSDIPEIRLRVSGSSPGLTLGIAGPLRESDAAPLAEAVLTWARALETEDRRLVFQDGRALKGETAATSGGPSSMASAGDGDRRSAYRSPDERASSPGRTKGKSSSGTEGRDSGASSGALSSGGGSSAGSSSAGGGGGPLRLGLLVPTAVLGMYVTYLFRHFRDET